MKKLTLFAAALLCASAVSVNAQSVSYDGNTIKDSYDFSPWNNDALLKLFAEADAAGRKYPTEAEFKAAGFNLDLEFVRSHVRPATIMEDAAKNIVSEADGVYPKRRVWMNIPAGQGDMVGGYPSSEFNNDVYSMWQYTNIFGAWNHSILQCPGSWADAAHRNGTHIHSGIKFFESWTAGSRANEWVELITTKNSNGEYRYVKPLVNCLRYLGLDGINYNFEDAGYDDNDVVQFHKACYRYAKEIGFDSFHIGIYTQQSSLSVGNTEGRLGTSATGKTADCMLNYSGSQFSWQMASSVQAAEAAMGTAEDLYAGTWISELAGRGWGRLNADAATKRCGICCWGEHKVNRIFMYTVGKTTMDLQANYQLLQEKFFCGGNRNVLNRPAVAENGYAFGVDPSQGKGIDDQLVTFPGVASYAPERTAIQGNLPFNTHFTLGNGDFYAYKGKKTLNTWYNMGQQDYVPTYRWLMYQTGTTSNSTALDVRFTHEDAYIGGNALRLTSAATGAGTDLVLYRAKLNVTGNNPQVKVALKSGKEGKNASNLSVIVKKFDESAWLEFPLGDVDGKAWQEVEANMTGVAKGDVIEYIGFRVKGGVSDYEMLVGQLMLSDDAVTGAPAAIDAASVLAEVRNETTKSMSVKLSWNVNTAGFETEHSDWDMVYNDEVNIDHFEFFYKNGEDGKVSEVGRTTTWSAFFPNLQFEGANDQPYVGVRSVSKDLKNYSEIVWVALNRDNNVAEGTISLYDPTYINNLTDGYETAVTGRWMASLKTTGADQNVNYTSNSYVKDSTQYVFVDQILKVKQGQTVTVTYAGARIQVQTSTGYKEDGLEYCTVVGYVDWDGNYNFGEGDEIVYENGVRNSGTTSVRENTFTINVPADAVPGSSMLRLVFSDAWFAHPGATGGTNKGFSIDIPMEISGTNTPRTPETTYRDLRDAGVADEPEMNDPNAIENITNDKEAVAVSSFYPSVAEDVIYFNNVEKAWIYTVDGRFVQFIDNAPESVSVNDLTPGLYVVKMQNGQIVRSQKLVKK